MKTPSFHLITFGCQMNVADNSWIRRRLLALGFTEVKAPGEADAVVVLTCSVREKPEQKVCSLLGRLERLMRGRKGSFVAVGGCLAQQMGESLWERFPKVRLIFGADGIATAPESIARLAARPKGRESLLAFQDAYPERTQSWPLDRVPPTSMVTIMQGCDNYCSYCIVPFVRGPQKSRKAAEVVDECRELARRGAKEIMLLGQNVNAYGFDTPGLPSFAGLLRQVCAIEGVARVRFTTSHPKDLGPDIIQAFADLPNLAPSLHLPVQSGSDRILAAMNRGYDRARYERIVADLRRARPGMSLSTDIIVGFPGETDEDFEQTMSLLRDVGFESSYSFVYSDRPKAAATEMHPKIDPQLALERLSRLQALQHELQTKAFAGLVGETLSVMVEGPSTNRATGEAAFKGRDAHHRSVNFASPRPLAAGDLVRMLVTKTKEHSLWGEEVLDG